MSWPSFIFFLLLAIVLLTVKKPVLPSKRSILFWTIFIISAAITLSISWNKFDKETREVLTKVQKARYELKGPIQKEKFIQYSKKLLTMSWTDFYIKKKNGGDAPSKKYVTRLNAYRSCLADNLLTQSEMSELLSLP